jgi:hypothetical protein
MHGRIKRAYLHIDEWSQHVDAGRFDLTNEDGDHYAEGLRAFVEAWVVLWYAVLA